MVKKVIMKLDSPMASGPDCIQVVVQKHFHKYVSEKVLFSRLLEGLTGGPCI